MFIDFTAIMLVGLGAGLVVLAHYLYRSPAHDDRKPWAAGFFAAGLLGLLTSVPMVAGWPLPGAYNIAFGEPALYLSIAFIGAAITLAFEWEPLIPALYGFFGALIAIIVGLRIINLGLTKEPVVAGLGFLTAGIGGALTLPAINYRTIRWIAIIAAIFLGISAVIFLFTGYDAYWGHMTEFAKWVPATMKK